MAAFLDAERIGALTRCAMGPRPRVARTVAGGTVRPGKKWALLAALVAVVAIFVGGCGMTSDVWAMYAASFSPDNSKLIFTLCRKNKPCTIATYDLAAKKLHEFPTPPDEHWITPAFSRDGTRIAFAKGKQGTFVYQIAIMNSDGSGVREVTRGHAYRHLPSFSPDGKRIIYVVAARIRTEGTNRIVDRDIFDVDIESGRETRLTDFAFNQTSAPFYFPDGNQFIFSAKVARTEQNKDVVAELLDKEIFIMSGPGETLRPAITFGKYSSEPNISADGSKILFLARTNELDNAKGPFNYDLIMRSEDDFKRLTKLGWKIDAATISFDGRHIVFLADIQRDRKTTMWTMNVDGSELTEVTISE